MCCNDEKVCKWLSPGECAGARTRRREICKGRTEGRPKRLYRLGFSRETTVSGPPRLPLCPAQTCFKDLACFQSGESRVHGAGRQEWALQTWGRVLLFWDPRRCSEGLRLPGEARWALEASAANPSNVKPTYRPPQQHLEPCWSKSLDAVARPH